MTSLPAHSPTRRAWRWPALLAACAALAVPAPASASFPVVGQLTQLPNGTGCVKSPLALSTLPCSVTERGIYDVQSVAVSPDGRFLYAASVTSDALAIFARDTTTGALTPVPGTDCIEALDAPSSTTCPATARGLDGPVTVIVSPDGAYLYVASINGEAIAAFSRDQITGALTQLPAADACVQDVGSASHDCSRTAEGLHGVRFIAISPGGENMYAASAAGDAVAEFSRNPATGTIAPLPGADACVEDVLAASVTHCSTTALGLNYPRTLDISQDGKNVYVASDQADLGWTGDPADGDAVAAFSRDPTTGALHQLAGNAACIEDRFAPTSTKCPVSGVGLYGAYGVKVAPDGGFVYVGGHLGDDVALFARDQSTGALSQLPGSGACIKDVHAGTKAPCGTSALGLDGAAEITITADGGSAYVGSFYGGAVAAFSRDTATGLLTQLPGAAACLEDLRAPSSTTCPTVAAGILGPRAVVLSPDDAFAYVSGSTSRTIGAFARTSASAAVATTGPATGVGDNSATLTGTIDPAGQPVTHHFEYGPTRDYLNRTPDQTASGTSPVTVSRPLTGLQAGGTYHYRLVLTAPDGVSIGADRTFTTTGSATYPSAVLGSGPVGYWRLGETSGTVAVDATGTSNGAYKGGVQLGQPGAVAGDGAARLDGSTGYVSVPDVTALHTGDDFTLEAWVKPAQLGVNQAVFSKGSSYVLFLDPSGLLTMRVPNVSTFARSSAGVPLDGAFHHVAVTKSGGTVRFYIDGADVTGSVSSRTISSNTTALTIGSGLGFFGGALDEAAVYPRALSAAEVAMHVAAAGP